jgi:hypothetical protein
VSWVDSGKLDGKKVGSFNGSNSYVYITNSNFDNDEITLSINFKASSQISLA